MLKVNLQLLADAKTDGEAVRGLDLIMSIGSTPIGGQKNANVSMASNVINTSTKTTGDWERNISGAKNWNASCDGFYYKNDAGYKAAVTAFLNSTEVDVLLADTDSTVGFKGKALITSLDVDVPYDDAMTYNIGLTGTGKLEEVTATV